MTPPRAAYPGHDAPTAAPARYADHPARYAAALAGQEVAEALTTSDRARLVRQLHDLGWTDVEIATHTRMTTFTTATIRARQGLSPHRTAATATTGGA